MIQLKIWLKIFNFFYKLPQLINNMSLHNQSAKLYFILDLFKFNLTTTKKLVILQKWSNILVRVLTHVQNDILYSILFYSGPTSNTNNSYLVMINSIIEVT